MQTSIRHQGPHGEYTSRNKGGKHKSDRDNSRIFHGCIHGAWLVLGM